MLIYTHKIFNTNVYKEASKKVRVTKTQNERLIEYLTIHGSITSLEAFDNLGITKLSAKIFDLKKLGYCFDVKSELIRNRYGDTVRYARYYLVEVDNADKN